MNILRNYVISEGTCHKHGRFRRLSVQHEPTGYCPTCKLGPVEMTLIGRGRTTEALPHYEATDRLLIANTFAGATCPGSTANGTVRKLGATAARHRRVMLERVKRLQPGQTAVMRCDSPKATKNERSCMTTLCARHGCPVLTSVEGSNVRLTRVIGGHA